MTSLDDMADILRRLQEAREKGLPASTVNGCSCDFCTGKKKHDDNWCPWCGKVILPDGLWWENYDQCDVCDSLFDVTDEGGPDRIVQFDLGGEG